MAEEWAGPETGGESVPGVDAAAMALSFGSASRAKADAFLDDQRALIGEQRHHLHEQLKHLQLTIWEKRMGVLLRAATGVMGLAVAGALAFMLWHSVRSNGLVIEPFSVPPELAARGLTGEVVAARLLDHLTSMQALTDSARPAKSYTDNWGEHGISLEIPETGISFGELDAFLRAKLGNDIHVRGEIVRSDDGLNLTARAGDLGADSITGKDGDVDALVQKLAESIYRITQPFRYGMYLVGLNRENEALPIFEHLAKTGNKEERLWSYQRWAQAVADRDGPDAGVAAFREALADNPDSIATMETLANLYVASRGDPEQGLFFERMALAHVGNKTQTYVTPERVPLRKKFEQGLLDGNIGAFHDVAPPFAELIRTGFPGISTSVFIFYLAAAQIGEHDPAAARATIAKYAAELQARNPDDRGVILLKMRVAADVQDWAAIAGQADAVGENLRQFPLNRFYVAANITPLLAYAQARLGRIAEAEARIAATPAGCYPCLRGRAQIAELQNQQGRADYWFARAIAAAPSIPFAYSEWGAALLARGQPDLAIEKFALANRKSPHFADALEGWGEALMAKNQSHRALAKFAEAEKYAPNWERLRLKRDEALAYSARKNEARAQFTRAAAHTGGEKAELAGMAHG